MLRDSQKKIVGKDMQGEETNRKFIKKIKSQITMKCKRKRLIISKRKKRINLIHENRETRRKNFKIMSRSKGKIKRCMCMEEPEDVELRDVDLDGIKKACTYLEIGYIPSQ